MLVSIIMPTYNSAKTLDEAIKSVISQEYTFWELLIIDDQSSDKSLEIAESYVAIDARISVLRTDKNLGSGGARNLGISRSKGELIAFLDSDDLWLANKLAFQVNLFSDKSVSFVCSAYERFNTVTQKTQNVGVPRLIVFKDLLKTNYIGCLTVVLRRDAFDNLKFPEMRKRQDYALWLSLIKTGGYVYCSNHVLARYRHGHESTTSNKMGSIMSTWKVYREFLQLKFGSSIFYFLNYLVRGFFRSKFPRLSLLLGFSHLIKE
jgi:glycosyltransferase involved in cell wall biosynthesis